MHLADWKKGDVQVIARKPIRSGLNSYANAKYTALACRRNRLKDVFWVATFVVRARCQTDRHST